MTLTAPTPRSTALSEVPEWRLTLHRRTFSATERPADTGLLELTEARSRRLETALNKPAQLSFSINGRAPSMGPGGLVELSTRVLAWRDGDLMFSGIVTMTEDVISEQEHTVNVTCLDDLAILQRRYLTDPRPLVFTQWDQDDLVANLLTYATTGAKSGNGQTNFSPGSLLPLVAQRVYQDGSSGRPVSGIKRDRTYEGAKSIGEAMTDLGACERGFDLGVYPDSDTTGSNTLRIYFPNQGSLRSDVLLQYGANVASLTRTVQSSSFANYVRHLGNQTTQGQPQVYADAWTSGAYDVSDPTQAVGLWAGVESASDVSDPTTLAQQALGDLAVSSQLTPSYSLVLTPGAYTPGNPGLGDTVGLLVSSGRLNVSTTVKVLGVNWAISDDLDELVELTVGRPAASLSAMFERQARDVAALTRR